MGLALRLPIAALALAISVLAASPARAQPRPYRDGVRAAENGDWPAVKRLMREAIAERAEERKRYTPHYWLGVASFELGDCDGGLAAWLLSERQGFLSPDQITRVKQGRLECAARRQAQQAYADAEGGALAALERAQEAAAALRGAVRPLPDELWQRGDPPPRDRQHDVETRLDGARRALEAARSSVDASAFAEIERAAIDAAKELDALRAEAGRLEAAHSTRVGERRNTIADLVARARQALERTRELEPYPRQIARRRADLEGLLDEHRRSAEAGAGAVAGAGAESYLQGLAARLSSSIRELEAAAAGPPVPLVKAAESFFAGDYTGVLAILAEPPDSSVRTRAHSLLLRSAARYYLWLEGGESDRELLAAATTDVAACRSLDAALGPPGALFSPRFVEFFAGVGALSR